MSHLPFIVIPGAPKSDGVTCLVVSLDNFAVTWACAGQSGTVTMTQWANDRGTGIPSGPRVGQTWAGYIGSFTVFGLALAPLEQRTGTVTQNGVSLEFAFRAKARAGQKFGLIQTTCHDYYFNSYGLHEDMRAWSTPVACAINIDDLSYVDNSVVSDLADSGHLATGAPATTNKLYDFALAWLARFGMVYDRMSDAATKYLTHYNHLFQYGNHERPDLSSGLATWNALFAHCQGTPFSAPRVATTAWKFDFGSLRVVASDPRLTQDTPSTLHAADLLDNMAGAGIAVLLFGKPRYAWAPPDTAPRWNVCMSRVLVDSALSPACLSEDAARNGTNGLTLILHGDRHNGAFVTYAKAAGTGVVAEKFSNWDMGGTTSGPGHDDGSTAQFIGGVWTRVDTFPEGSTTDNANIVYKVNLNPNTGLVNYVDPRGPQFAWTRMTCHGDEWPLRVTLEHRRQGLDGVVYSAFTRNFTQLLNSNDGSAAEKYLPRACSGGGV